MTALVRVVCDMDPPWGCSLLISASISEQALSTTALAFLLSESARAMWMPRSVISLSLSRAWNPVALSVLIMISGVSLMGVVRDMAADLRSVCCSVGIRVAAVSDEN